MAGYWDDLETVIDLIGTDGWASQAVDDSKTRPRTMFQAVRLAAGISVQDVDNADVTYWNWRELRLLFATVWEALDAYVKEAKIGSGPAVLELSRIDATPAVIKQAVGGARKVFPSLDSIVAQKRPSARNVINPGKVDHAIANTLAVMVASSGLPYGEYLDAIRQFGGSSDEDSLAYLDSIVDELSFNRSAIDKESWIPRELLRARNAIRIKTGDEAMSLKSFLVQLDSSNNLTSITDASLLGRLLIIAPETGAMAKRVSAG
jgi:hypothetical protein